VSGDNIQIEEEKLDSIRDAYIEEAVGAGYHHQLKNITEVVIDKTGHASNLTTQRYQARETRIKKTKDFAGSNAGSNNL
jgi:hypothetical protein